MDYFILDLVNKKIVPYDSSINDSFIDGIWHIQNINIKKFVFYINICYNT